MTDRPRPATLVRGLTVLSVSGLLLVVLGVATVAMLAEFAKTWRWYFRMERAIAVATPIALLLLGLSVGGMLGIVALASRD